MRPRLFRQRCPGRRGVRVLHPRDRQPRCPRSRGELPGCLLPPKMDLVSRLRLQDRETQPPTSRLSPRQQLAIHLPPSLPVRDFLPPQVNGSLQRAPLRGRRLPTASSPASLASASAVTRVTAARHSLVTWTRALRRLKIARYQLETRGRGSRKRVRPALRALRASPAHRRRQPMRVRSHGRPRWRYATFGQSRAARPSR